MHCLYVPVYIEGKVVSNDLTLYDWDLLWTIKTRDPLCHTNKERFRAVKTSSTFWLKSICRRCGLAIDYHGRMSPAGRASSLQRAGRATVAPYIQPPVVGKRVSLHPCRITSQCHPKPTAYVSVNEKDQDSGFHWEVEHRRPPYVNVYT